MNNGGALGIDLGGTQIKAVLVEPDGNIVRRATRPTDDTGDDSRGWADTIRSVVNDWAGELAVGLAAPGLVSADQRAIATMPGRLRGLEGLDWTQHLDRPKTVPVMNDAHASLLGEAWIGAAQSFREVIMLTLGTGVGGAIISNGALLRGHGGRAGHLGHVSLDLRGTPDVVGTPGSLEYFIGNQHVAQRTDGKFRTTEEIVAAVARGDRDGEMFWSLSIRALACAITSFVNIIDPEAVIIGGGIAAAGDALFIPLQRQLDTMEWRPAGHAVKLLPARLGEWAGAIGAARNALSTETDCPAGDG